MRRLTPNGWGALRQELSNDFTNRYFDTLYMLVLLGGGLAYAAVETLAITDNSLWNIASLIIIIALLYCLSQIARLGRQSRNELARQRDILEQRVDERSKQLEQAQLVRTLELQRFAEFGRLSAHMLHDLTSPLTAASLHLQQMDHRQSSAVRQALKNLQQLERYVDAARKQLKTGSTAIEFSVDKELRQLLRVIRPLSQRSGVRVIVRLNKQTKLYGDPVRFNQIMANLIVNAIDAYDGMQVPVSARRVVVDCIQMADYLEICVNDQGRGIEEQHINRIFEPFYSTKPDAVRGLGIGLSIVKQSISNDFYGHITVSSSLCRGTTFTAQLRNAARRPAAKHLEPETLQTEHLLQPI